jgi:hypothetical protein
MKKATLVLATAVAFLLSGPVFAARKVVDMPSTGSILSGSTSSIAENGILKVSGAALVGEYIPGVKNALAVVPETKIASSAISGLAKNLVKGGLAGVAIGVITNELIDGVGWIMTDGAVAKPSEAGPVTTVPSNGDYYWGSFSAGGAQFSSANEVCSYFGGSGWSTRVTDLRETSATCVVTNLSSGGESTANLYRRGSQCPSGSTYNVSAGACTSAVTYAPISDSDLPVLDGFIKGKDGVWQRGLTTELCGSNEDCFKSLQPQTSLTGPSTVTGTPQTVTTTAPNGTQSVSVKTPTSTITYGPNYYDYTTSTTTTTNNGGDSTTVTDDTDTSFPVPPDIFGGANDGLGGIRDSIPTTTSGTSPIPYMAWWSFSQSCNEITFIIPVYGAVTTALCPIYKQYIWPVLYFFFAVFTWLTCFEIWRKTVMRVRAS